MILDRVDFFLRDEWNLSKMEPLVVGVSGGPDSLCLLEVLRELGYPLVVAHFDHQLRRESAEDARVVGEMAARMGLPFVLGAGDVRALASARRQSVEEAARNARYSFLFDQARQTGAGAVAVAHTADDQVETVLMHLLRGSGLSGLKGMLPLSILPDFDGQIPLVRPLLTTWREEILAFCREHALQPLADPSNADRTFFRNRLRHELIPFLQGYNPQVKDAVLRMAASLSADHAFLQDAVSRRTQACVREEGPGFVVFELQSIRELPLAMQHGLIRWGVGRLRPGLRDLDFEAVERAVRFVQAPPAARHLDLAAGLDLECERGSLVLKEHGARLPTSGWPQLPAGQELPIPVPGTAALSSGWQISAALEEVGLGGAQVPPGEDDPDQAWLDADLLEPVLLVRGRRPGDRFTPFGMGGRSIKVKDYFINEKVPQRARDAWPLLYSGGALAWIPGLRPAEDFRISAQTRRAVHLRLVRPER